MSAKKIIQKISTLHLLLGAFFSSIILIAIIWLSAPSILDWGTRYAAAGAEVKKFELEVARVDPWETRIEQILIETKEADFSLGHFPSRRPFLSRGELSWSAGF